MLKPILYPIDKEVIDKGHYYEIKDNINIQQQNQNTNQKLILKELLEFILNKQIQSSQRELVIKAYRRVLLEEKKEQWLRLCNYSDSFLNQFNMETKFMGNDDVTINQALLKLNQIVKHFIPEYLESKSKELTVDNEFIENNLKTVLSQLIEDLYNYKIFKSDVQHGLEALKYYQQETCSATLNLIQSLNNYIKYVLLYDVDCQQLSIENNEIMLNTFQQTFLQWYEKSKGRLNDKLNVLKKQAENALMEKKKYELELEMLSEYEFKLREDSDLKDMINQNKELRNQIQELKQKLKKQQQ